MADLEKLAKEFEAQYPQVKGLTNIPEVKAVEAKNENVAVAVVEQNKAIVGVATADLATGHFGSIVGEVQKRILKKAEEKITDEKLIDKQADSLAKIADKALEVEAEMSSLQVQEQDANNKVRKQRIKNDLIKLRTEAILLKKEQEQLKKEQKADHKARNKQAKWELYKDKLKKMKYDYVPCAFVLGMLLFFDGVKSFFDGLRSISVALTRLFIVLLIVGGVLIVLFSIPVTKDIIVNLLKSKGGT